MDEEKINFMLAIIGAYQVGVWCAEFIIWLFTR